MKLSVVVFLSISASASAFVPSIHATGTLAPMKMSDDASEVPIEEVPRTPVVEMSLSMPFMPRPVALDGSMAGDVGFDPLGFAKDSTSLMNYREAEIRHSRLAMLAAAGWPLSELFNKKISALTSMTPVVDASDRAPSVLNGGLGKVPVAYWIACVVGTAAIEAYTLTKVNEKGYYPGKLGFDPLGLYGTDSETRKRMELAEIKNGRLAMIAITAFAVQEFVYKLGVVDETPLFFKPLGSVLMEYANSGYIQH